ncbi:hypothetical protein GH714_007445 [Hevea brasiliensis]|uniref:Serine carboxypeptidase-like 18 n=1 Tax=Hevea brasiliensis TaxID=3981 RepID=A0A6A6L1M4_HEVBR|nr:hypothetical protein GH714_007445 [Hevea brasiliensis]
MPLISGRYSILSTACIHLLLLFFVAEYAESGMIVQTLPGFSGVLPFKLETGYVTVNESELFYLFVESQGKPKQDPLLVYLIGGPGCSALNGFFFQTGPLLLNTSDYSGGLPQLFYNEYTWTKTSSIIFLDAPVGSGYSYATSSQGYYTSDTESMAQTHVFLRKANHQEYVENQFFIASDSYSGVITPILALAIIDGNEAGLQPTVNLQGILSRSPHTNSSLEANSKIPLAYSLALISRSLYESAKNSCNENYVDVDSSNAECLRILKKSKSGDHDLVVPYIYSRLDRVSKSKRRLCLETLVRSWYTVRNEYNGFRLTFATLKGAGHSPTQYKPLECYNMFERWIHYYPL